MCSTHFKSSVRAMCFLPRLRRLWGLAQCMEWGESQLLLRESWERLSTAAWPKWHETDASDAGCHEDMKLWWSVHCDRLWLRQSLCIFDVRRWKPLRVTVPLVPRPEYPEYHEFESLGLCLTWKSGSSKTQGKEMYRNIRCRRISRISRMHLKVWGWCSRETTACLRYNCHSGYSNWFFGWSAHKKSWCCNHKHLGCPGTWHGSYHLHTNVMHGVGHAHGRIYDCHAGFSNWKQGWSDSKKDWCCSHEKKGCLKYHCHSNALWPRYVTYVGVFLAYFFWQQQHQLEICPAP